MVGSSLISAGVLAWVVFCTYDIVKTIYGDSGIVTIFIASLWALVTTVLLAGGHTTMFVSMITAMTAGSVFAAGGIMLTAPPDPELFRLMGNRVASIGIYIIAATVAWSLS